MIAIASHDGRALYALLDALEQDGFITLEAHLKRWRELQVRVKRTSYSEERAHFHELIRTMDRADQLDEGWIQAHWRSIQAEAVTTVNESALPRFENTPLQVDGRRYAFEAINDTPRPLDQSRFCSDPLAIDPKRIPRQGTESTDIHVVE
jgi:hypothetical protein